MSKGTEMWSLRIPPTIIWFPNWQWICTPFNTLSTAFLHKYAGGKQLLEQPCFFLFGAWKSGLWWCVCMFVQYTLYVYNSWHQAKLSREQINWTALVACVGLVLVLHCASSTHCFARCSQSCLFALLLLSAANAAAALWRGEEGAWSSWLGAWNRPPGGSSLARAPTFSETLVSTNLQQIHVPHIILFHSFIDFVIRCPSKYFFAALYTFYVQHGKHDIPYVLLVLRTCTVLKLCCSFSFASLTFCVDPKIHMTIDVRT